MRVSQSFDLFYLPDWTHEVANVLDSETRDILVHRTYSGSTIIDFEIKNPTTTTMQGATNQIRRLSGNEKMLLLYQWWLTQDEKMEDFSYDVIDFKVYAEAAANDDDRPKTEVVELFAPSSPMESLEFQTRPDVNNAGAVQSGFYFDQTTLQVTVTVNSAQIALPSVLVLLISLFFLVL